MPWFCSAILFTKSFAALFNASMRFVPSSMEPSIEPEASSTNTISSGVVEEDFTFEVDESAERAVMNAESPRLMTLPLLVVIVSVDTVLSVHIRPMFAVLGVSPPRVIRPSDPHGKTGSAHGSRPPAWNGCRPRRPAKAKLPPKPYKSKR